jgi:hypothetical protein
MHKSLSTHTHINSLTVITKPIAKVHTLDIELGELLVRGTAHEKGEEGVFDVSVIRLAYV